MRNGKKRIAFLLVGVLVVGTAGCDVLTIASAGVKLASGQVGDLTSDEIRVLSQTAAEFINAQTGTDKAKALTQDQSQAIVNFLDANNVQTIEDLEKLEDLASQNPGAIQGLDELAQAFAGSESQFDAENVTEEDLENLFGFFNQGGGV